MSRQPAHTSHDTLSDLPSVPELAVIINVQTKHVSTLALLSTLRHLELPTVVIDCESQDGTFDCFPRRNSRSSATAELWQSEHVKGIARRWRMNIRSDRCRNL